MAHLAQQYNFDQIVPISTSTGLQVENIQQWVNGLLPESTIFSLMILLPIVRSQASEIIREIDAFYRR